MNRIFIGYDPRQAVSYTVLQQSILTHAKKPVAITPLCIEQLPLKRTGLTPFTFSRFLVPHLCDYEGWGLFLDVDILLNHDISELFELADPSKAIMVSKNDNRFEWASVMLFNCSHEANKILTPAYIEEAGGLHGIKWCDESLVGDLPREWNHLVGYDGPKEKVNLIHYTQGVPAWQETMACEYAKEWQDFGGMAVSSLPWADLMGNSVHSVQCNGVFMPKFLFNLTTGQPKPEYLEIVTKMINEKSPLSQAAE